MTHAHRRELQLATAHGELSSRLYRGGDGSVGLAIWLGDVRGERPLRSRMHSSCYTSEALGGLDCDCVGQLDAAFHAISRAGRGIVFYLLQEGRGAGLQTKLRDREIVQRSHGTIDTFGAYARLGFPPDLRTYGLVPEMCKDLGIEPALELMTNNPVKVLALERAGITVNRVAHDLPASEHNAAYLDAKARSGHRLRISSRRRYVDAPPELEALDVREPFLAGFRRIAAYSLPIRHANGIAWFRATGYVHERTGHDRVILSHRAPGATRPELRCIYREDLYERLTQSGPHLLRYRADVARILEHGAGTLLGVPVDSALLSGRPAPDEDEDRALLEAYGEAHGATRWEALA